MEGLPGDAKHARCLADARVERRENAGGKEVPGMDRLLSPARGLVPLGHVGVRSNRGADRSGPFIAASGRGRGISGADLRTPKRRALTIVPIIVTVTGAGRRSSATACWTLSPGLTRAAAATSATFSVDPETSPACSACLEVVEAAERRETEVGSCSESVSPFGDEYPGFDRRYARTGRRGARRSDQTRGPPETRTRA